MAMIASYLWRLAGDKEAASNHHRIALETLEKMPESIELAILYEDISHMLWRTGMSHKEAWLWAQKAFEVAERLNAFEVLVGCYNDFGALSHKNGEYEKAVEYYKQGLKVAIENNVVEQRILLYNNLSELYLEIGEFQKGFEIAKECARFAEKIGRSIRISLE